MCHCVSVCFYCTFVFLYNIVSGQLTLLLLLNKVSIKFSWSVSVSCFVNWLHAEDLEDCQLLKFYSMLCGVVFVSW